MKTLYLECNMGAAGDMLTAALLELCPDKKEAFLEKMNSLGLNGVEVRAEESEKCGIKGTHISVSVGGVEEESLDVHEHHHHDHEHEHCHEHEHSHDHGHGHGHSHSHSGLSDIEGIIGSLDIPQKVKKDALGVYRLIAEAEAHAHGKPITEVHFHEVGTADAIADIVGACLLMYEINPEKVICSPIHVGSGNVRCAHGVLPVPAPATAYILRDVPTYGGDVKGELCTPTGAALLKYFARGFGPQPVMKVGAIGYGMGKKDFERANCVRAMVGESDEEAGEIVELACNLDDMTPEDIAFACETFFENGALDVYTVAASMKKSRYGVLLTCMCKKADRDKMVRLMFEHTGTLGIREYTCKRYTLERAFDERETPYGKVRVKRSFGFGCQKEKPEYEDLAAIARKEKLPLAKVRKLVK